MDLLQAPMTGHIAVESNEMARRVVEANFPDSLQMNDVREVDEDMVLQWSLRYSNVGLVLIGSGPLVKGSQDSTPTGGELCGMPGATFSRTFQGLQACVR